MPTTAIKNRVAIALHRIDVTINSAAVTGYAQMTKLCNDILCAEWVLRI